MNDNTNLARTTQGVSERDDGGSHQPELPVQALTPPVDIVEDDAGITLLADMPGVSKERLGIRVDGEHLVIEGSAEVAVPASLEILHSEIRNPHFRRSFTLSRELDTTKIAANLKDGVLRLTIPKAEAARPRRIDVQVA
jgi:HSP20 family protein